MQITGTSTPRSCQTSEIMVRRAALAMCRQFHVARKSMPPIAATAMCIASANPTLRECKAKSKRFGQLLRFARAGEYAYAIQPGKTSRRGLRIATGALADYEARYI